MNTFSASAIIKSFAKSFTALALASGTATLLPNCTSETSAEIVGRERAALACNCPTDSGTCGTWTCDIFRDECTFKASDVTEGDRCTSAGSEDGTCMLVTLSERDTYFMCCTGCVAGKTAGERTCQSGSEVGYCGDRGFACDGCTECQSCTEGTCKETTGNDCGTCKICNAGNCVDKDPGAACQGGRCALAATCCSSCIDSGGACLSSTNEHCGLSGASCRDCGECSTCASGACQPTTGGGCDDGNPCTEDDTCTSGTCAGTPVPTDDGNPCTTDGCTAQDGVTHTNLMAGAMCDDGAACTNNETCNDHDNNPQTPFFTCLAPMGVDCADGNPCTSDVPPCMGTTCPHTPEMNGAPCANDLRCVFNKACEDGACTGEARNCNDDNPCTTDSCDEMDGPNVDPVTGCKHEPRSTSTTCDDSNACTDSDHCTSDGSCAGTVKACTALDECHGIGSCDPGAGECTDPRVQDGTACENTGLCADGECQGGTPVGSGGSGGSGGGAQGGEGGDATGDAGEPSEAGSAGTTGGGSSGRGGSGGNTGGVGGATTSGGSSGADSTLYVRDPGGCSCRVAGSGPGSTGYLAALAASVLALFVRRRRAA